MSVIDTTEDPSSLTKVLTCPNLRNVFALQTHGGELFTEGSRRSTHDHRGDNPIFELYKTLFPGQFRQFLLGSVEKGLLGSLS